MSAVEVLRKMGVEVKEVRPRRYVCEVPREKLHSIVSSLVRKLDGKVYASSIVGIDRPEEGVIELSYNLWVLGECLVSLRVKLPRDAPEIETITDVLPGAYPHELEAFDLLGVKFIGNDKLREPAFKPEDMPPGTYPLRKDWKLEVR